MFSCLCLQKRTIIKRLAVRTVCLHAAYECVYVCVSVGMTLVVGERRQATEAVLPTGRINSHRATSHLGQCSHESFPFFSWCRVACWNGNIGGEKSQNICNASRLERRNNSYVK